MNQAFSFLLHYALLIWGNFRRYLVYFKTNHTPMSNIGFRVVEFDGTEINQTTAFIMRVLKNVSVNKMAHFMFPYPVIYAVLIHVRTKDTAEYL